jgi:hypothetical protein
VVVELQLLVNVDVVLPVIQELQRSHNHTNEHQEARQCLVSGHVPQRKLHRLNDVPIQLPAYPTCVFVVTDGPLSFPVGVVDSWWVLLLISVGKAIELFILEEAADQEDDVRLQDNHPEFVEEKVGPQVLIEFVAPLLVAVAQP